MWGWGVAVEREWIEGRERLEGGGSCLLSHLCVVFYVITPGCVCACCNPAFHGSVSNREG